MHQCAKHANLQANNAVRSVANREVRRLPSACVRKAHSNVMKRLVASTDTALSHFSVLSRMAQKTGQKAGRNWL